VVALLHGGFWRASRTLELMRPLAADLAARGFAAWNLEYRRVGQPGGGWPGTCQDVAAGLDHLAGLTARERLESLAGVCDLHAGAAQAIGEGAVTEFLGATPDQAADRYRLASPRARLPLGVAQLLVHGDADTRVPVSQSRAYAAAAAAAGDPVELVELAGVDHMAVIDPTAPAWAEVTRRLARSP
jgi:acetyl esterase/lipase